MASNTSPALAVFTVKMARVCIPAATAVPMEAMSGRNVFGPRMASWVS